jgi:hypothetical protein
VGHRRLSALRNVERAFANPEAAARKPVELAKTAEAVQDGRIHIEKINYPFF